METQTHHSVFCPGLNSPGLPLTTPTATEFPKYLAWLLSSFLFKMFQNLLPTRKRLHRIGKSQSRSCNLCYGQDDTTERLFTCLQSTKVTTPIFACLSSQADNLDFKDVTELNIHTSKYWKFGLCRLASILFGMKYW